MPDRNWNTGHNKLATAKARQERVLGETRRLLGGLFAPGDNRNPVFTRAEFERLIHRAALEYHITPHLSRRGARDLALQEARRLVEQLGPRGDRA